MSLFDDNFRHALKMGGGGTEMVLKNVNKQSHQGPSQRGR